jgi:hypothetical protein
MCVKKSGIEIQWYRSFKHTWYSYEQLSICVCCKISAHFNVNIWHETPLELTRSYTLHLTGQQKICDIKGLVCLSENLSNLLKLMDDKNRSIPCDCLSTCESLTFQILEDTPTKWFVLNTELWSEFHRQRNSENTCFTVAAGVDGTQVRLFDLSKRSEVRSHCA